MLEGGVTKAQVDSDAMQTYLETRAMQGKPDGLSALSGAALRSGGLQGVARAVGAYLNPSAQANYLTTGSPVAGVQEPGGGRPLVSNAQQNVTYNQPYYNLTLGDIAQMQFPEMQHQAPMSSMAPLSGTSRLDQQGAPQMIPQSPRMDFGAMADPRNAPVALSLGAEALPTQVAPLQGRSGLARAMQGSDADWVGAGPVNAPRVSPRAQQSLEATAMPIPVFPQAPPKVVAAAAPAQGPPAPPSDGLRLKGDEEYDQKQSQDPSSVLERLKALEAENVRLKTRQIQESNPPAPQPQRQAPPAPPQRPAGMPPPWLMAMSPKLTDAYLAKRAAEAKGRGEAAKMAKEHEYKLEEDAAKEKLIEQREMKVARLKGELDKHMTAAQEAEQVSKFWKLPPGSNERWDIAHQIPHLRRKIDLPQDEKAASEAKISQIKSQREALGLAADLEKDKYIDQVALNEAEKLRQDVDKGTMANKMTRDTWDDQIGKSKADTGIAQQNYQQNQQMMPMQIQSAALDAIAKVQGIDKNETEKYRNAFSDAMRLHDSYVNALSYLPPYDPNRIYYQSALNAFNTALGAGEVQEVKDKHGRIKNVTKVEGDKTLGGQLFRQGSGRVLQGGLQVNSAAPHPAQTPSGFLVPPPPTNGGMIPPSLVQPGQPLNLAGIVQGAQQQFPVSGPAPQGVPSGLAQAPLAQPMQAPQPVAYNPAFGQPRSDVPPGQQALGMVSKPPDQAPAKTAVQQSIAAGRWVGSQPPTLAEQLQMLPTVLSGAFGEVGKAIPGAIANAPGAIAKNVRSVAEGLDSAATAINRKQWEQDKKAALNPFVTPQSRGFKPGSVLTDPELISYFATKSTSGDFQGLVRAAGWEPPTNSTARHSQPLQTVQQRERFEKLKLDMQRKRHLAQGKK